MVIKCEADYLTETKDGKKKAGVEMFCLLVSLELDHTPQAKLISALSHALPRSMHSDVGWHPCGASRSATQKCGLAAHHLQGFIVAHENHESATFDVAQDLKEYSVKSSHLFAG